MKKIILLLLTIAFALNINAQASKTYIDEAVALVKIKSFIPSNNSKKCDVYAYIRTGNRFRKAKYFVEFKHGTMGDVVFREEVDFNHLENLKLAKSYRQKDDVFELFFGLWIIKENTIGNMIIVEENGNEITIPIEFTNYKNPITIMN